jgi:HK97 family phage prohead protease
MKRKVNQGQHETRIFAAEVRAQTPEGETLAHIVGYGAMFDKRSENLGGFREIIKKGAFDEVLDQDVRGFLNHDPNYVLGRTTSGTMTLSVDERGLHYDITPPDTQTIRDLVITPMARGDINQSSFTFIVARDGDHWYEDDEGVIIREIRKVSRLFDVSPVSIPAYPDTTAASRGLTDFEQNKQTLIDSIDGKEQHQRRERQLSLNK